MPRSTADETNSRTTMLSWLRRWRLNPVLTLISASTTVAYRPYTALTRNILSLSLRHSTKCAILIHCATVVLDTVLHATARLRQPLPDAVVQALLRHPRPAVRADAAACAQRPQPEIVALLVDLLGDLHLAVAQ